MKRLAAFSTLIFIAVFTMAVGYAFNESVNQTRTSTPTLIPTTKLIEKDHLENLGNKLLEIEKRIDLLEDSTSKYQSVADLQVRINGIEKRIETLGSSSDNDSYFENLQYKVTELENRIAVQENITSENLDGIELQGKIYDATIKRYEVTSNILLAVMTITGVLIAFFSITFVNRSINKSVEEWLNKNAVDKFESTANQISIDIRGKYEKQLSDMHEKYDKQFAELYKTVESAFTPGAKKQ